MTAKPNWKREMDRHYIDYLESVELEEIVLAHDIELVLEDLEPTMEYAEETDWEEAYWERVRENREEEMQARRQSWLERYI